jgi:hypothetical protein
VTQNFGPDPFEVSDSATMVAYLQTRANEPSGEAAETRTAEATA